MRYFVTNCFITINQWIAIDRIQSLYAFTRYDRYFKSRLIRITDNELLRLSHISRSILSQHLMTG